MHGWTKSGAASLILGLVWLLAAFLIWSRATCLEPTPLIDSEIGVGAELLYPSCPSPISIIAIDYKLALVFLLFVSIAQFLLALRHKGTARGFLMLFGACATLLTVFPMLQ